MKRFLLTGVLTLAAAVSALASAPSASIADIPYEFIANGKTLPAGRYSVEIQPFVMKLKQVDGSAAVAVLLPRFQRTAPSAAPGIFMKRDNGKMHLVAAREANSNVMRILGSGL